MKTMKKSIGIVALAALTVIGVSCKDGNKNDPAAPMSNEMRQEPVDDDKDLAMNSQDTKTEVILNDYFNLKDALVGDDNEKAKELGAILANTLGGFDTSTYAQDKQQELVDIIEDATEHAEHIAESDIKHQREHFKILSKDVTDMVAITGTDMKLYEQFCPMYDGGSAWLSMNEEVRNPYYGSSMLKCGKVQREIN